MTPTEYALEIIDFINDSLIPSGYMYDNLILDYNISQIPAIFKALEKRIPDNWLVSINFDGKPRPMFSRTGDMSIIGLYVLDANADIRSSSDILIMVFENQDMKLAWQMMQ